MQGSDQEAGAARAGEASGKSRGRLSVRIKLNSAAQPAQSQGARSSPALPGNHDPLPAWQLSLGRHGICQALYVTALQAWLASQILMYSKPEVFPQSENRRSVSCMPILAPGSGEQQGRKRRFRASPGTSAEPDEALEPQQRQRKRHRLATSSRSASPTAEFLPVKPFLMALVYLFGEAACVVLRIVLNLSFPSCSYVSHL